MRDAWIDPLDDEAAAELEAALRSHRLRHLVSVR
jgi:hypothetical protein